MAALAGRKAKIDVIGVAALAENMPSGSATRPGDVVKSMSGQTIEILNTDAEGRMVLADALWYTQDRFKPRFMVDLATLTGAVIVALGSDMAGILTPDDTLATQLVTAGLATGEHLWRLPLTEAFDKSLDSDIADVKHIAGDRGAGSSIGGQFLKRFVNDVPWAHLDIAGVAWSKKDKGTVPKGATAFGVRLLNAFVAANYEGVRSVDTMEVRFYHLMRSTLEQALPQLLEKAYAQGMRCVVMTGSEPRVTALDTHLWSYQPDSFLPHGNSSVGNAPHQPIWLTASFENPNDATVLFLVDGVEIETFGKFSLCCTIFDGADQTALETARAYWKRLKKPAMI